MTRRIVALLAALALIGACRSADKSDTTTKDAESSGEGAAGQAGNTTAGATPDCSKGADLQMCCQALTPACNQCRDDNQKAQERWDAACLKPIELAPDCKKDPPVVACCGDDDDACRDCREAAFAALMSWKQRCADEEMLRCDRAPPQSDCCTSGSPTCESCAARNRRMRDQWRAKCGRDAPG